jgi:hypothetical protein
VIGEVGAGNEKEGRKIGRKEREGGVNQIEKEIKKVSVMSCI